MTAPNETMSGPDRRAGPPCIAIDGNELAIFADRLGFLGKVIKKYEPFDDEETAIESAKITLRELGYTDEPEIRRPRIKKMTVTYGKKGKSK